MTDRAAAAQTNKAPTPATSFVRVPEQSERGVATSFEAAADADAAAAKRTPNGTEEARRLVWLARARDKEARD